MSLVTPSLFASKLGRRAFIFKNFGLGWTADHVVYSGNVTVVNGAELHEHVVVFENRPLPWWLMPTWAFGWVRSMLHLYLDGPAT